MKAKRQWSEEDKSIVAEMRSRRVTNAEIGVYFEVDAETVIRRIFAWRKKGDTRFVLMDKHGMKIKREPKSPVERFSGLYKIDEITGCWNFIGKRRFRMENRPTFYMGPGDEVNAYVASWRLFQGPVPKGMLVCHKCDNPQCVNSDHLFIGTNKDNSDDKISKGRHLTEKFLKNRPRGDAIRPWRVTADQVKEIRRKRDAGERTSVLAKHFGVSLTTIRQICARKTWSSIT